MRGLAALVAVGALCAAASVGAEERVDITATDGVQLIGHLSGTVGPGVVLVGDPGRTSRDVAGTAEAIANSGFRVLRFDLRGRGESEGAADPATIDRDTEGAFRYLIGRKIRPVLLVGEGASAPPVVVVGSRVGAARVVVLGSPHTVPTIGGVRIQTMPGDLVSAVARPALVDVLKGRADD